MIVFTPRMRFIAGFLALAMVAAIAWQKLAHRPIVVACLADGSELRLVGFTVGTKYEFTRTPTPLGVAARIKDRDTVLDLKIRRSSGSRSGKITVNVTYLALPTAHPFNDAAEVELLDGRSDTLEFDFPAPSPIPVSTHAR